MGGFTTPQGLGSLAGATPYGAAANLVGSAVTTPNTSQSGDVTTGAKTFGGINSGFQVPTWVWGVAVAFIALVAFTKLRRK